MTFVAIPATSFTGCVSSLQNSKDKYKYKYKYKDKYKDKHNDKFQSHVWLVVAAAYKIHSASVAAFYIFGDIV